MILTEFLLPESVSLIQIRIHITGGNVWSIYKSIGEGRPLYAPDRHPGVHVRRRGQRRPGNQTINHAGPRAHGDPGVY